MDFLSFFSFTSGLFLEPISWIASHNASRSDKSRAEEEQIQRFIVANEARYLPKSTYLKLNPSSKFSFHFQINSNLSKYLIMY